MNTLLSIFKSSNSKNRLVWPRACHTRCKIFIIKDHKGLEMNIFENLPKPSFILQRTVAKIKTRY